MKNYKHKHLYRMVQGQLKSTIDIHGSINKPQIPSAAKRIVTQILAVYKLEKK